MSHSFTKQPSERFTVSLDFSRRLGSSETISEKTVTATSSGTDYTSTVIDSSTINGDAVEVKVKAGSDGISYKITVVITTSSDNVFEDEITMTVSNT